jgi:hypothetical protein
MANAAKMVARRPLRTMLVGFPGAGKTGSLSSLVDMGYKIRFIDYDGNADPLFEYVKDKDKLANVDIVYLEDKMRIGGSFIEPAGIPDAFVKGVKLLDQWKYTDVDGTEVDLGASKDWGCDTIVVLDSLTKMGDASYRRAMKMLNKTPTNMTQQGWGLAMAEQAAFIEKLTSAHNRFHVIVLAHLKMIAPKDVNSQDHDVTKALKEKAADLIPTRYYPSALGYQLPQAIGGEFPMLLEVKAKYGPGTKVSNIIRAVPRDELDVKLPSSKLPKELDISDGLAQIFKELAPPLAQCVS